MTRITVVVDNTVGRQGLLAEHGWAVWLEHNGHNILFDTGQGLALEHNARVLGLDLGRVDALVLSHGHYDHTGGLETVLRPGRQLSILAHPAVLTLRWSCPPGGSGRAIGIPQRAEEALRRQDGLRFTEGPTEIAPGVHVTGEVPRRNGFEDVGGPFFLEPHGCQRDDLPDDQAMYIESAAGTLVVLGCAHAGTVNTLEYIQQLTGRPILTVIGGMHLGSASPERVAATIDALRGLGIERIIPAHCTGFVAAAWIREALPERFEPSRTGLVLEFG